MKVGIVGCGGMGTTHILALKALSSAMDLEVVAIADCRSDFLLKAADHFPDARRYVTGEELIRAEELDLIHICLPSYLHTSHAVLAMQKGMNVFIEKPVCLTREEGELLLKTQQETGVQVMVGQVVRSTGEYLYLKEAYEKKTYGACKSIVMQRVGGDPIWGFEDWFHAEEKSGSVVLDLHVHDLDFLRYMLGEPDHYSVASSTFESGMINQIITSYQFGETMVSAEGTWEISPAYPFSATYRATFEDAVLVFSSAAQPPLTVYRKDGSVEVPEIIKEYDVSDNSAGINISDLGPYYNEIKYFIECLKQGRKNEVAPLEEGVKSVYLGIKVREAAKANS